LEWPGSRLNRKSLGIRLGGNYLGMAWDKAGWKWLGMGLGVGKNGLGMRWMYIHYCYSLMGSQWLCFEY